MKIKTSTAISLKFTLFTTIILFLFGLVVNFFYFSHWYIQEKARLEQRWTVFEYIGFDPMVPKHLRERWPEDTILTESDLAKEIYEGTIFLDISRLNNNFIIYSISEKKLTYSIVSYHVYSQINLLLITLYMIFIFLLITYFISYYFVKTSLKNLNCLIYQIKDLDIDNLSTSVKIWETAEDDEIKILADTINLSLERLDKQTKALKDFISNASHELKTPLMEISTQLDLLSINTWTKEEITNIKKTLKNMNMLIENLLFLSRIQAWRDFSKQEANIFDITKNVINTISDIFKEKNIKLQSNLEENLIIYTNPYLFEILVKNLLENAYKYTPEWWEIKIYLDNKYLTVEDNWQWIKKENLEKIWNSFYQEDESKTDTESFGLGLHIINQIIHLLNYQIRVESEENNWTKFTIKFA